MKNQLVWKEVIKDYSILACKTPYGAVIMIANHVSFGDIFSQTQWLGGFVDLDHAKRVCYEWIDKDIKLEKRMQRAEEAYNAIMQGGE